jgi:soluble lytic murein transglycosylase
MEAGEHVLARYLKRYLTGARRTTANAFYELRRQPQRVSWRGAFATDTAENRAAISYGIRRLARRDAPKAASAWRSFRASHAFDTAERQLLDDHVAVGLAGDNQFPSVDQRVLHTSAFAVNGILDAAIAQQRWAELLYWATQLSDIEAGKTRTQYWLARAQQQRGEPHSFADLATRRDYYGFLAAAQIRADAELQAAPPKQLTRENEARLLAIPGIARAVELFAVGDDLNARREWYRMIEQQDQNTQQAMAYLAQRMGKLFLAIQTANRADARNDLTLRFPSAYAVAYQQASLRNSIDPYLLQAITRQESAFQVKAKSSAGALGLMQVMPATAKLAIRRGGLTTVMGSGSGKVVEQDLVIPERNIEIGSYHLAWLLRRYSGLRPLAIAAYNAGESRVDRWLRRARSIPMDVWIETIPFKETRNYVQNVLAFEVVYRELEQRGAPVLRGQEWVTPKA